VHNHGQLQIGDVLTEGEALTFKASLLRRSCSAAARLRDPMKAKQLQKACASWAKRVRCRCSSRLLDTTPLIGAVGQLQFEVVEHRLKSRIWCGCGIRTRRYPYRRAGDLPPDAAHLSEFVKANQGRLAKDVDVTMPTSPIPA